MCPACIASSYGPRYFPVNERGSSRSASQASIARADDSHVEAGDGIEHLLCTSDTRVVSNGSSAKGRTISPFLSATLQFRRFDRNTVPTIENLSGLGNVGVVSTGCITCAACTSWRTPRTLRHFSSAMESGFALESVQFWHQRKQNTFGREQPRRDVRRDMPHCSNVPCSQA